MSTAVLFDVHPGGSGSFMYNDFAFYLHVPAGMDGIVVRNGAYIQNASLRVRGNWQTSGSALSTACLRVVGNNSSNVSSIARCFLDIAVETDESFSNSPITLFFGAAHIGTSVNSILNCSGHLVFTDGWSPSNVGGNQLSFGGVIVGDSSLTGNNSRPSGWL